MLEFFHDHSRLTAEPEMVKHNTQYLPLNGMLSENAAHRIVLLLLAHPKAREVVIKMRLNGIENTIGIVRQFIACNWDALEQIPDISDDNSLNFEYVDCGHKGANRRCPYSTPLDPKPYCIIKSLLNIPNYAYYTGIKRNGRRAG